MKRKMALLGLVACLFSVEAFAGRLVVEADAPLWQHFGAGALLYTHIVGGAIGLVSGLIASFSHKGAKTHRLAGQVFFWSMFSSYFIATCVAPFLDEGQRPNFVAGVLALYLLLSGVGAARRKTFVAGIWEKVGLVVALLITAMGLLFMYMGSVSDTGTVDGSPPQAFVLFTVAGIFAASGEANVLMRGSLSNGARVVRHLWRMCFSFFIAAGSVFFGQLQAFPDWFAESLLPIALGFLPLLILAYWLVKTKLNARAAKLKHS